MEKETANVSLPFATVKVNTGYIPFHAPLNSHVTSHIGYNVLVR